jgi:hypothetical protein
MGFVAGLAAKAAMGALMGLMTKLVTRELFESIAEDTLIRILQWEADSTKNTVDDEIVARIIRALGTRQAPKPG